MDSSDFVPAGWYLIPPGTQIDFDLCTANFLCKTSVGNNKKLLTSASLRTQHTDGLLNFLFSVKLQTFKYANYYQ